MINYKYIPKRCPGIYAIINKINNKRYVGRSVRVKGRLRAHKNSLKRGDHHSTILQRAWDKYGEKAFIFIGLELFVDKDRLVDREQIYIDLKSEYNCSKNAKGINGRELGKPVCQYTLEGDLVAEFISAVEASEKTGIDRSTINNVCREKHRKNGDKCLTAGGFLWAYKSVKPEKYAGPDISKNKKAVNQYTLGGRFIRRFDSIIEASKSVSPLKGRCEGISKCCATNIGKNRGRPHYTSFGYRWSYEGDSLIEMKKEEPIVQLKMDGTFLKVFSSLTEACKELNIKKCRRHVRDVANNKRKSTCGYKWRWLDANVT